MDRKPHPPSGPRQIEPHAAERHAEHNLRGDVIYRQLIRELLGDWAFDRARFNAVLVELAEMSDDDHFDITAIHPDVVAMVLKMSLATAVKIEVATKKAALKKGETGWNPDPQAILAYLLDSVCGPETPN